MTGYFFLRRGVSHRGGKGPVTPPILPNTKSFGHTPLSIMLLTKVNLEKTTVQVHDLMILRVLTSVHVSSRNKRGMSGQTYKHNGV